MTRGAVGHRQSRPAPAGATRKATFRLDEALFAAIKDCVESGLAASQTAFVEEAIRRYLSELRESQLEAAYAAAAEDPAFMADMTATTEAFEEAVADGLE